MKYAFKVTTNGRALLAELMAKEKPLEITRAVFGSGISVSADGTITASSSGITPDDMASSEDTEAMLDEVFPKES